MKILVLVAAALALLLFSSVAVARDVYIVNNSELSQAALVDALPAFQASVDQDFGPVWDVSTRLIVGEPTPGQAWMELLDTPECFFCAGYHDVQAGVPHAEVGIFPEDKDKSAWQVTFTHELFELLADPFINRGALVKPSPRFPHKWYALEVCDPVEANALAYTRPGVSGAPVAISDFVTEAWFRRGSKGPWDFRGATKKPLSLLEDGYQLVWSGVGWTARFPKDRE